MLITLMAILVAVGVSLILWRFDVSKNPTTTVAYRPNIPGSTYQSGKPIDIYAIAVFMLFTSAAAVFLSSKIYAVRRSIAIFTLASTIFLLVLSTIVANALISLQ
jgi:hypothetical protein